VVGEELAAEPTAGRVSPGIASPISRFDIPTLLLRGFSVGNLHIRSTKYKHKSICKLIKKHLLSKNPL
jgi:hypothetical protein